MLFLTPFQLCRNWPMNSRASKESGTYRWSNNVMAQFISLGQQPNGALSVEISPSRLSYFVCFPVWIGHGRNSKPGHIRPLPVLPRGKIQLWAVGLLRAVRFGYKFPILIWPKRCTEWSLIWKYSWCSIWISFEFNCFIHETNFVHTIAKSTQNLISAWKEMQS